MDERQKDLSNYRITQADDSLKVADYCLKETNESIYITQNDEGDMVIKSIDTYEMNSYFGYVPEYFRLSGKE